MGVRVTALSFLITLTFSSPKLAKYLLFSSHLVPLILVVPSGEISVPVGSPLSKSGVRPIPLKSLTSKKLVWEMGLPSRLGPPIAPSLELSQLTSGYRGNLGLCSSSRGREGVRERRGHTIVAPPAAKFVAKVRGFPLSCCLILPSRFLPNTTPWPLRDTQAMH